MAINPSVSYPTKTAAPTADYPYGAARNVTTPGDLTGYPLDEAWVNDWLGFQAAAIDALGETPSGSSDTAVASQVWDSINKLVPPGAIVMGGNLSGAPTGFDRLLILSGQTVLIVDYQDLVDNTYVGDGANSTAHAAGGAFVKTSDAAGLIANTAGPYFLLPDPRGAFIRGTDTGAGRDPDGVRHTGAPQDWAIAEHMHPIRHAGSAVDGVGATTGALAAGSSTFYARTTAPPFSSLEASELTDSSQIPLANASADESRPVNIALPFYIRY
jgi:hypothetical protein